MAGGWIKMVFRVCSSSHHSVIPSAGTAVHLKSDSSGPVPSEFLVSEHWGYSPYCQ